MTTTPKKRIVKTNIDGLPIPDVNRGSVQEVSPDPGSSMRSTMRIIHRELARLEARSQGTNGLSPIETKQMKDYTEQLISMMELELKYRQKSELEKLTDAQLLEMAKEYIHDNNKT